MEEPQSPMLQYAGSFNHDDKERVFRFLATFSRWEYALKHNGFCRRGARGQAEPDWRAFAIAHDVALAAVICPEFVAARGALLANPPKYEKICGNGIEWHPNPRRPIETVDADYLLRVVRDIRNNLFHGGKFSGGSLELAQDRHLINNAIRLLEGAAVIHPGIKAKLDEPVQPTL
jgi:hypothetical protein